MTRLIADDTLPNRIKGLEQEAEICDEQGRTLGRYLPEQAYTRLMYDLSPQIPDEEIARRLAEPGGCSLQDIWRRLGRSFWLSPSRQAAQEIAGSRMKSQTAGVHLGAFAALPEAGLP